MEREILQTEGSSSDREEYSDGGGSLDGEEFFSQKGVL
jgi:hypothetical protein